MSSLRIRFIVVFISSVVLGIGVYFLVHSVSFNYINNVYLSEENKKDREKSYIEDLQSFVKSNEISSEDTTRIARWARENKYVYLIIYKDNELFYTSDDPNKPSPDGSTDSDTDETVQQKPSEDTEEDSSGDSEKNETADSSAAEGGGLNKEPGGVTVDYPTREELFEYAKKNGLHTLDEEGKMFAYLTEFTEYLYYDIFNIVSLISALFFVLVVLTLYFHTVTSRIIRLGQEVNKVADGDVHHVIKAKGKDEISRLSVNVDNMRESIIENFEKEKAAIDANNALITSMSHDIRTPLTVLLGYIDVMQNKSEDNPEMQGYLKAAESTAMRLKKLSDDMFSYFLVFGGKQLEISMESYDAATLIDQMLFEHITLMTESGYEVKFDGLNYEGLKGREIYTDAQKLVRIFDNVFSNIYKYADKASPVTVYAEDGIDTVTLRFSNVISKSDKRAESNGIGLKTCKKLGEYIDAQFEYAASGEIFTAVLTLKLIKSSN